MQYFTAQKKESRERDDLPVHKSRQRKRPANSLIETFSSILCWIISVGAVGKFTFLIWVLTQFKYFDCKLINKISAGYSLWSDL